MRNREEMKLRRYLENSRRFLHKAKDLYVKNVEDFADKLGYAGGMACPTVHVMRRIPRRFNYGYQRVIDNEFIEAYLDMIKARLGNNRDLKYWQEERGSEYIVVGPNVMTRSYSICLGGLARIDEDRPCCFDHEPVSARTAAYALKWSFL